MNGIKKAIRSATCLCLTMLVFGTVACNGANSGDVSPSEGEYKIWSQDGLSMTLRDEEVNLETKSAPSYEISGGRGEYESAQIIISAGVSDISSYTVEMSDLVSTTDNTQKITADNIDIYIMKSISRLRRLRRRSLMAFLGGIPTRSCLLKLP